MSNWVGSARTNYVKVADMAGLVKALEDVELEIVTTTDGLTCFLSDSDGGTFPGYFWTEDTNGEDEEQEFDFQKHVIPYLAGGEVLITIEVGAEKLRYLTGFASAYTKDKDPINISLADIYEKASKAYNKPITEILLAEY